MQPKNFSFGGGTAETAVNPIVLFVVLVAGAYILFSPRGKAIVAFLAAGILIPTDEIMVLGGVHFPMLRVLAIFGLARVILRKFTKGEAIFGGGLNAIDKAVVTLATFIALDGILLWREPAEAVFQIGNLVTTVGVFFLARSLIRDEEDVKRAIRVFAYIVAPIALLMLYESITGHNPYYAFLGGARADVYSSATERGEHFRATGVFAHPIIAGTFGGMLVPVFVALLKKDKGSRTAAWVGIVSSTVIPFAVGSSTALFALIGGLGALLWWPMRRAMRALRWGIIATLAGLQCAMKSPVWHIIQDVSLSRDSSSYHRYMLVDQCIRHFWVWALIGTKDYPNWGWDAWDLSNQYVGNADTSGLIPLVAFISILVFGYKYLGRARRHFAGQKPQEFFIWAIAASLFANTVAFWGISYWDQIIVAWYTLLAIISVVTLPARQKAIEPAVAPAIDATAAVARPALELISVRARH